MRLPSRVIYDYGLSACDHYLYGDCILSTLTSSSDTCRVTYVSRFYCHRRTTNLLWTLTALDSSAGRLIMVSLLVYREHEIILI